MASHETGNAKSYAAYSGSCDVLLSLMGKASLTITDAEGRRRLDDPDDFVRLEIETALARNIRVVPVLVDGARMPRADQLRDRLVSLVRRQALELTPARFESDTGHLLQALDQTITEVQATPKAAEAKDLIVRESHARIRSLAIAASLILAAGGALAAKEPQAVADTSDVASAAGCDVRGVPFDLYGEFYGGSTFVYANRLVYLKNGRGRNYTHGEISPFANGDLHTIPYQPGDRVWVDRSINGMPKTPVHPSTDQVQAKGSWKQCGPFSRYDSDSVINWDTGKQKHFAVRVCIDHPGNFTAHCGAWYTDST